MLHIKFFAVLIVLPCFFAVVFCQTKPFPQHVQYFTGTILPTNSSRTEMDNTVRQFYNEWKKKYVKEANTKGQYFIWSHDAGDEWCVSEGQGYGMVTTVLMAGYDVLAKEAYDGMYRYFKAHQTAAGSYLMAWEQNENFNDKQKDAATDGDMDIAYSLLLADKQWGSSGQVNYLNEAKKMIDAIKTNEVNVKALSILISSDTKIDSRRNEYNAMRCSDFMPGHFKAFAKATNDNIWLSSVKNNYKLFDALQDKYSNHVGLLSDFIINVDTEAKPAPRHYKEKEDDKYYYNACRVPWRIAIDYLLNGDPDSKKVVTKINQWIKSSTKLQPIQIAPGYQLNGTPISKPDPDKFASMCFLTPFAVAAMIDSSNQVWLNSLWSFMNIYRMKEFNYYDNTIKLLNMIILSGNYWKP